jgi:hypothetical protein
MLPLMRYNEGEKLQKKPLVGAEEEMGETLKRINIDETIKINPV